MKKYLGIYLSILFTILVFRLLGQETVCNNGLDDDGDNLVDCFDSDCSQASICNSFFFGNEITCEDEVDVQTFNIKLKWRSASVTATSHATPVVGDLDKDGIPEVVVINNINNLWIYDVFILDGQTGTVLDAVDVGFVPENTPAIADVVGNDNAEILITSDAGRDIKLLDHQLETIWERTSGRNKIGIAGFADFNEDGTAEVYYKNEILNAKNGRVLIEGETSLSVDWGKNYVHGPIAIDILDASDIDCMDACGNCCAGLELITGHEIWAIEINNKNGIANNSRTVVKNINDHLDAQGESRSYHPKRKAGGRGVSYSSVSVADYNLDGYIDVLMPGALGSSGTQGKNTIFFWDVHNERVTMWFDPNNFVRSAGRINIGDVDGDGQMNANFVLDQRLYSLDENLNIHWVHPISEGSSGYTGCTLFDFDGNGTIETVYRSEQKVLILDGVGNGDNTTFVRNEFPCVSRTQEEYPLVVDVDGDGASEICVTCYSSDAAEFDPYSNTEYGQVRVYESDGELWMPARSVWNQHAYFNVNINDDLSVPIEMQDHSIMVSDGVCAYLDDTPVPFPNRPLNGFLNQSTILDEQGCLTFASANLVVRGQDISVTKAACPDTEFEVTFTVRNRGDKSISAMIPVSYYAGNPITDDATYLETHLMEVLDFKGGGHRREITHTIENSIGGNYTLFVIVNDPGGEPPIASSVHELPSVAVPECSTNDNHNNIEAEYNPFPLTVEKLEDDRRCDLSLTSNGSATAYYLDGTNPLTEADGFNFFWFNTGNYEDTLHQGSTFSQIEAGTYEVIGSFDETNCTSDTVSITIDNLSATSVPPHQVRVWIYEINPLTNCNNPNGTLGAFAYTQTLNGTFPASESNPPQDTLRITDGYTFSWFITSEGLTPIGSGETIINLQSIRYTAEATEQFSGCTGSSDREVSSMLSFPGIPDITVNHITTCGGTGVLSANVGGNTSDFTFEWFVGSVIKPVPDFVGAIYNTNNPGEYTLSAIEKASLCTSNAITVTLNDNASPPNTSVSLVQNNTSCISGNGIITADGDGTGTVIGFTFNWYKGPNTLATNALPGPAEPNAFLINDNPFELGGLTGGTYRVVVTEDATDCETVLDMLITDDMADVAITPSNLIVNHINSCELSTLGSIDASLVVPDNVYDIPIKNINESFEDFDILAATNHELSINGGNIKTFDQEDVPGWSTTASDGTIEIWHSNNTIDGNIHKAFHGNQFAEINANETAALYFDLNTPSGTMLSWSFAHKGRNGTDALSVNIGAPDAVVIQNTFSTGNTTWALYSGNYSIPIGQHITRFQFEAISSASGNTSTGNFIDSITFVAFPYRFELHHGTNASGTADDTNIDGVFNDLTDGHYVLVIYDNLSGCNASEIPFMIQRNTDGPNITTTLTHDFHCDTGAGHIDVTSSIPAGVEPSSYTYQLFDGHAFVTQIGPDVMVTNGAVPEQFGGLEAGDYRVRVINNDNQCDAFVNVVINDETVEPSFEAISTVNNNVSCNPANPVGSLAVSIDGEPDSDYSFTWYDGNNTQGSVIVDDAIGQNSLNNLGAGFYTVVAENISNGCETEALTLEIYEEPYIPNVIIVEEAPQTTCGSDGNGSLRAYVTNDPTGVCSSGCELAESDNFSFAWFAAGTTNPRLGNNSTVTGLTQGNYRVEATYTPYACANTATSILSENQIFPALTLNNVQPNTGCLLINYNGEALVDISFDGSIVVDPIASGYDITWRQSDGSLVTDDGTISGSSTEHLQGVIGGSYSITTISPLGCTSNALTVNIPNNPTTVVSGASASINNSVCTPDGAGGIPDFNGSISFTPTTNGITTIYDFALSTFGGTSIAADGSTGNNFSDVNYSSNGTTSTVTGLPPGDYTMSISDIDNMCNVEESFNIVDDFSDIPVIGTVTVIDNSSCDPTAYNGSADVSSSVSGGSGTYTYSWTTTDDLTTIIDNDAILDDNAGTGTGVQDGDYILTVTDALRGCVSAIENVTIETAFPSITPSITIVQDNFSCSPTNPNGSVRVGVAEGPNTNYSFEWYEGTSALGTVISTGDQMDNLLHGTYTVLVQDNATLCTESSQGVIREFIPTLSVSLSSSPHNDCYPSNGTVAATPSLTFSPAGPPTGFSEAYSYQWFLGTGATPGNELMEGVDPGNLSSPTNVNTNNISGLSSGDYTVLITESLTGCVSAIETVTVVDGVSIFKPTVSIDADIIPTSCANEDGRITATITALGTGGLARGDRFSFEWYEGAQDYAFLESTGSANALITGDVLAASLSGDPVTVTSSTPPPGGVGANSRIDNVIAGLYTLVTIEQRTGCRYFDVFELGFLGQQIATTLTIDNIEECSGDDFGEAKVGLADNIELDISSVIGSFITGEAFTTTGGVSGTISRDNSASPTTIQVSLNEGSPALSLATVITGTTSGARATIANISYVGYATGLGYPDDITQYDIYLYAGSGVPADRFTPYEFSGKTFPYLYNPRSGAITDGDGRPLPSRPAGGDILNPGDSATFPELPAGNYVAIARQYDGVLPFNPLTNERCWSTASADEEILNLAFEPVIQRADITNNTLCGTTYNGQLAITVIEDPRENANPAPTQQPNGYRFTWVDAAGDPVNTITTQDILTETATSTTIADLEPGDYTVTIQRLGGAGNTPNGCSVDTTLTVNDNPEQHLISGADVTVNADCNPLEGAILILNSHITDDTLDYEYTWYITYTTPGDPGNILLESEFVDYGLNNLEPDANSASGLEGGIYYVEASHITKGCVTPVFQVEIPDVRVDPIFDVTVTAEDIICDDTRFTPTGQASLTITSGSGVPADYNITWFESDGASPLGTSTLTASFSTDREEVSNLPAGTYFVQVEDITSPGNGCLSITQSVIIDQFNTTISVGGVAGTDFIITHANDCDPANGTFEILDITETRPGGGTVSIGAGDFALSDYIFDWFESDRINPLDNVPFFVGSGSNNGDPGANAVSRLAPGTYYVQITNETTGCTQAISEFVEFTINDSSETIAVLQNLTSEDTFCDNLGNVGGGNLSVDITQDGGSVPASDFIITWYRGANTLDANEIFPNDGGGRGTAVDISPGSDFSSLGGLAAGNYTVTVADRTSPNLGCNTSSTFNVGSNYLIPTLSLANIEIVPDTTCTGNANDPSGVITLEDDDFGPAIDGLDDLGLYDIIIRRGTVIGSLVNQYTNESNTSIVEGGLAPDDYFIIAEHTETGCFAATARVNVPDYSRNPQIELINITPDRHCGEITQAGSIEIIIDDVFDETTSWFTAPNIQWYTGTGTHTGDMLSGENSVILSNVSAGEYTVEVTNGNTSCSQAATFTVPNAPMFPSIFNAMATDNTICDDDNDDVPLDNGIFEVMEVVLDGAVMDQTAMSGNYTLRIYTDPGLTIASELSDTNPITPFAFENLGSGIYYASIVSNESGCPSNAFEFEIADMLSRPLLTIALQEADFTCRLTPGLVPNGTLYGTVDGGLEDTDPDYLFQWYLGSVADYNASTATALSDGTDPNNGSVPTGSSSSTISGLKADIYTLEVTRLSSGCVSVDEFIVPNVPVEVEILQAEVTDATTCPYNGIISATNVSHNNLIDYTFLYYDVDPTTESPSPVFTGNSGASYTAAEPGVIYYIVGLNTLTNCMTLPYEVQVGESVMYPEIVLDSFGFQTNCDPSNPNGSLTVSVDGAAPSAASFHIQWYNGVGIGDPLDDTDIGGHGTLSGTSTATVSGIPAGFFTIQVTNNAGCSSIETFEMTDKTGNPIAVTTSVSANINCIDPNGQMAASIVDTRPDRSITDYNFYWYIGDVRGTDPIGTDPLNPTLMPDFIGSLVTDIMGGEYTLFVIDVVDPFCQSNGELVEVENGVKPLTYTISTTDVTTCFDTKNGSAEIEAPDLSEMNIEWLGSSGNLIADVNQTFVKQLAAGRYILRLTDVNTRCITEEAFEIYDQVEIPETPTITLGNNRTNCSEPNANAMASMDGKPSEEFLFEWFSIDDPLIPHATGEEVFHLDSGIYEVYATNLSTNCKTLVSGVVEIKYEIADPVFHISHITSTCLRTNDGAINQFNGIATVEFDTPNNAYNYQWYNEQDIVIGEAAQLIDAIPGTYTVYFIADNGCEYSETFTISTDIVIYNGLSPNDDGLNDFLLIDCIDYFNNNVKIFNRDGAKVYEISNYDNITNRFEGRSNVGGSQNELPSGTYYAVVELDDGREPLQFYLELVR